MGGEEMYHWFENELNQKAPEIADKLAFSYEPTVTPGVYLGKISLSASAAKALVRSEVRPEGVRMIFPLGWQQELSDWLGVPPAEAYRLKSNWVNQPSIGVAVAHFDSYFKQLGEKVIELLQKEVK
jgi:hypothetical protein